MASQVCLAVRQRSVCSASWCMQPETSEADLSLWRLHMARAYTQWSMTRRPVSMLRRGTASLPVTTAVHQGLTASDRAGESRPPGGEMAQHSTSAPRLGDQGSELRGQGLHSGLSSSRTGLTVLTRPFNLQALRCLTRYLIGRRRAAVPIGLCAYEQNSWLSVSWTAFVVAHADSRACLETGSVGGWR